MEWKKSNNKITLRERREKMRKVFFSTSFRLSLVVFTLIFGLLYLYQTNSVSTKGYKIYEVEKQIKELENENRRLNVEIAKIQSIQNLQERAKQSGLVAVDKIDYLTNVGSAVAMR